MLNMGDRIKHAINTAKIDRAILAKKIGISRPYLSQIENNARTPGRDKLIALAKETGFPIGFFTGEDDGVELKHVDKYLVFAREIDEALEAGANEEEIREAIRLIAKIKARTS